MSTVLEGQEVTRPLSPTDLLPAQLKAGRFLQLNKLTSRGHYGAARARETAFHRGYARGLLGSRSDFFCDYGDDGQAWHQFWLGVQEGSRDRRQALEREMKGAQH